MAKWVKPRFVKLASQTEVPLKVPAAQFLTQLSANGPMKKSGDGPRIWAPAPAVYGSPNVVPGTWLWSGLVLDVEVIGRENHGMIAVMLQPSLTPLLTFLNWPCRNNYMDYHTLVFQAP